MGEAGTRLKPLLPKPQKKYDHRKTLRMAVTEAIAETFSLLNFRHLSSRQRSLVGADAQKRRTHCSIVLAAERSSCQLFFVPHKVRGKDVLWERCRIRVFLILLVAQSPSQPQRPT